MLVDARVSEDRSAAGFPNHVYRLEGGQLVPGDISRRAADKELAERAVHGPGESRLDQCPRDVRTPDCPAACDLLHPIEAHVHSKLVQALDHLLPAFESSTSLALEVSAQCRRPVIYEIAEYVKLVLAVICVDLNRRHQDYACVSGRRQPCFYAANRVVIRDPYRPEADARRLPNDLLRG